MSAARVLLVCLLALGATAILRADPIEPPPEAEEGVDYEAEPADSIAEGNVEVGFASEGRAGSAPRRTRRLRFSADSLDATLREGDGDPLAGGSIEGRGRGGRYGVGRLAPRWGRGLLLGAPAEPWSFAADDRGTRSAYRGRAGDGAWLRGGDAVRYEALYGRFARRGLAGFSTGYTALDLGALGDERGEFQASVAMHRERSGMEWVMDRAGRWRAEAVTGRALGDGSLGIRVRGGHDGFRSLAEPKRSGPSRVLALNALGHVGTTQMRGVAALWRFRAGIDGARTALEFERPLGLGDVVIGLEEQHGLRREPTSAAGFRSGGFRQGWWAEWRRDADGLGLALRHEAWGARAFARDPVRTVTSVRVEAAAPFGASFLISHAVYRALSGSSVYLPEVESDRLVLRAVTGEGERTRIEARLPAAGGTARGSLSLSPGDGRGGRARWTLDWTRRTRLRRRG